MGSLIISRALVIALACGCAAALTQLSAAGDDSDCALYLNGPGRTSAYDYSLNLLKGNFAYEGQHTCITYDAVNQAYLEARNRIVVAQPKGDWKAEDFASVGELILDISINLARRYGLTYEEIEKGLPLIDTSRTLIRDVCPPVFSHVQCRAGKYRRFDGLCNNLQQPTWGSTMAPFQRLLGPLFADGINAPRIAHTGRDLPLSRVVSRTMHPDDGYHDHAGTVMVIAWGQFMDHDYTLTGTPLDPINRNDPEECCKRPPHLKHPYCNEIRIPEDDRFYGLWNVKCIDFVRAFPSPRPGCRLGSRVPFNTLTGVIDGNTVYGVTDKFSRKLRTGFGGLLRMNPVFKEYGLKELLPLKLDIPDEGCTRPSNDMFCFEAGEIRVNEQLVLTVMHTLMAREHNRIAKALAAVNPHWDDETLFQETRRINVAEIQHITYNEFLPILLGKDVMEKFGLVLEKEDHWDGYDPQVNPDVIDAFASAAFRFGHSLLPTAVERWSKAHKFIASKRLSNLIRRPFDLYRAGVLDEYVMGLMNQVAQAMDDSITQEVTNHLFKKVGARFGMDLVSFNMQRGREFGIPGYMEYRKFCGLNGADSFQDLFGSMPNETVRKYESIFEHPVDVDLWSGGVSERPLPGSMLGPTFACVIATQFSYSRRGDRFWYELPNQPSSFTREQLAEVRKARLARVICDNTDIIDTVQLYPMVLPDHELNPRVPCRSGIIPSMDFSKWAEPAPFHGPKPFVTEASVATNNETDLKDEKLETSVNNTTVRNVTLDVKMNEDIEDSSIQLPDRLTPCNGTTGQNCTTVNCTECHLKLKESHGTDTVLKYVYKKDDIIDSPQKPSNPPINSLRRKRRSNYDGLRYAESAPLIVNYETSHGSYRPTFQRQTNGIIKNAALADFNIETLHDILPTNNNEEIKTNKQYDNEDRSGESENRHKVDQHVRENEDSADREDSSSRERSHSNEAEGSAESHNENNEPYRKVNNNEGRSQERDEHNNADEDQSRESYKEDNIRERDSYKSKESYTPNSSEENSDHRRKSSPHREPEHSDEKEEYINNPQDSRESSENDKKSRNTYPESRESIYDSDNKMNDQYRGLEQSEEKSDYRAIESSKESKLNRFNSESDENKDKKLQQSEENDVSHRRYSAPTKDSNEGSEESSNLKQDTRNNYDNRRDYPRNKYSTSPKDSFEDSERSEESIKLKQDTKNNYDNRRNYPRNKYSTSSKDSQEDSERSEESSNLKQDNTDNYDKRSEDGPYHSKPREESSETSAEENAVDKILHDSEKSPKSLNTEGQYYKNSKLTANEPSELESQEEEAIIAIMTRKNKKPTFIGKDNEELNTPIKIKDIDLSDFSNFERIRVNSKGIVEPLLDTNENYETLSAPLIKPLTTSIPHTVLDKDTQSARLTNSADISLDSESHEDDKPPIQIDNEEVKPVIEFNADKEESDENNKEALKTDPNEDTSLETLLGVKDHNSDEKSDKVVAEDDLKNKGDVKQQFERIPLNYDHAKKEQEQNSNNSNGENPDTLKDSPKISQGTVDGFIPQKPVQYDEHLNIKFDDVSIKLPDIKLPEDILAYTYDDFDVKKNNKKKPEKEKFFHYDEQEYNNENPNGPVRSNIEEEDQDGHEPSYYNKYYGIDGKKQDYRKKKPHQHEDYDEEEEDLYEKFVRERFGKRGTFEKRSEKLTAPTVPAQENAKLFHALNQVLKKAANIEKEAVQSGDPNAGYMWTVEYGKPL